MLQFTTGNNRVTSFKTFYSRYIHVFTFVPDLLALDFCRVDILSTYKIYVTNVFLKQHH